METMCYTKYFEDVRVEDVCVNANGENMKQVNIVIKALFCGISDDEMNHTLDTFWSEYKAFNYKNGAFYGDGFIWRSKEILKGSIHIWHQK